MAKESKKSESKESKSEKEAKVEKTTLTPEQIRQRMQEIQEADALAFAAFEASQKAKRETALAEILEPLRTERNALAQTVNDANIRIGEIDKEIGNLTGTKTEKPKGTKKPRLPAPSVEWIKEHLRKETPQADLQDMADGSGFSRNLLVKIMEGDKQFKKEAKKVEGSPGKPRIFWSMK